MYTTVRLYLKIFNRPTYVETTIIYCTESITSNSNNYWKRSKVL